MGTIFADLFKAWDRLSTSLFRTAPLKLDQCRKWRNLFIDAVK